MTNEETKIWGLFNKITSSHNQHLVTIHDTINEYNKTYQNTKDGYLYTSGSLDDAYNGFLNHLLWKLNNVRAKDTATK
jgi:hypothetical protein